MEKYYFILYFGSLVLYDPLFPITKSLRQMKFSNEGEIIRRAKKK